MQVGCTALGVDDPVLQTKIFDMCIIDEAGQITLPACLGPILKAKAFTLVGDPYQLPPLVQNRAAAEAGLSMSLLEILCKKHRQACFHSMEGAGHPACLKCDDSALYDCRLNNSLLPISSLRYSSTVNSVHGRSLLLMRLSRKFCLQEARSLTMQYRMAEDIQLLANTLIYNNQLCCGSEAVRIKALDVCLPKQAFPAWLVNVRHY